MMDEEGDDYPDFAPYFPRPKLLKLPLPDEYVLTIDFADDATVAIRHRRLQEPLVLGIRWGCFMFPVLRWTEIALLERRLQENWKGDFSFKYLPLLLNGLAAFTETDKLKATSRKYWADWRRAGVLSDDLLDENMTFNVGVGKTVKPVEGLAWRHDARCGWVVDGAVECLRAGYRAEEPTGEDLSYFREIRRFFRVVERGWTEESTPSF